MWSDSKVKTAAKFLLALIALVIALALVGCGGAKAADLATLPLALILVGLLLWSIFARLPSRRRIIGHTTHFPELEAYRKHATGLIGKEEYLRAQSRPVTTPIYDGLPRETPADPFAEPKARSGKFKRKTPSRSTVQNGSPL